MSRARDRADGDFAGKELIFDADGDTSITADTDDQIDIRIAGADDFAFKANTFEVQTGSNIDMNGTELILDADADTSITADTDDRIDFKTGGTDRMKINSNGSVGIGTATTTGDLNISPVVGSYSTIQMTTGGATTGNIIYFGDSTDADYSSITSFGSNAGENGRMRFIAGTKEALNILNDGTVTVTDGDLKIGTSGHGIDFSATGDGSGTDSSELLDDYEEGTWTPTLTNGGSVSISAATYTKIGNIIRIGMYIAMSSIPNNNSAFYIGGLPYNVDFTSGGSNDHYHGAGSVTYVGTHNVLGFGMLPPTPYTGQATMYFHRGDGNNTVVLNSNMTGCPYLILATSYKTA